MSYTFSGIFDRATLERIARETADEKVKEQIEQILRDHPPGTQSTEGMGDRVKIKVNKPCD